MALPIYFLDVLICVWRERGWEEKKIIFSLHCWDSFKTRLCEFTASFENVKLYRYLLRTFTMKITETDIRAALFKINPVS